MEIKQLKEKLDAKEELGTPLFRQSPMSKVAQPIRVFQESVVRVFKWLPVIWKDRDYDYIHLIEILQFKLKQMAELQVKNGSSLDRHQTAAEILHTAHLLELAKEADDLPKDFDTNKTSEEEDMLREAFDFIKDKYKGWWD